VMCAPILTGHAPFPARLCNGTGGSIVCSRFLCNTFTRIIMGEETKKKMTKIIYINISENRTRS
jgi:hypothetical protein